MGWIQTLNKIPAATQLSLFMRTDVESHYYNLQIMLPPYVYHWSFFMTWIQLESFLHNTVILFSLQR